MESQDLRTPEAKLLAEPEASVCRSNHISFNLLSLHSNTQLIDRNQNNEVVAARQTDIRFTGTETRTDFSVKQADGSVKHFEEYPTPLSSLNPRKANIVGPLYEYDPKTDKRGKAVNQDSPDFKTAEEALQQLRAKYTPEVILNLPRCK